MMHPNEAVARLKATSDSMPIFEPFSKIPRWSRDAIVTEKLDGTNASIHIHPVETQILQANGGPFPGDPCLACLEQDNGTTLKLYAGARNNFIVPKIMRIEGFQDNHGFAAWALANAKELFKLGPGSHFGEWWGSGIQRNYGLLNGDKRFSLFNALRWVMHGREPGLIPNANPAIQKMQQQAPACCHVVPVLGRVPFDDCALIRGIFDVLRYDGSVAAPGFMKPEGIIIHHIASQVSFKKTVEKDEEPKGASRG